MKNLAIVAKSFSRVENPSKRIQFFVEKNLLRLSKVKEQDWADYIDCWYSLIWGKLKINQFLGKFKTTDRVKYHMALYISQAIGELRNGDRFWEALQFLGNIEHTFIKTHFRKINGICINIFSQNYKKFPPKTLVIILDNLYKIGVRHSLIPSSLTKYWKRVNRFVDRLSITDQICLLRVLNYSRKNKATIGMYHNVFDQIYKSVWVLPTQPSKNTVSKKDDIMNLSKFLFLLETITECMQVAESNDNIKLAIHELVSRYQKDLSKSMRLLK